jgi:tetratricopeptide (TPR) repeat protein
MRHDANGLAISTDSDAAAAAYDHVVTGYLKYRADLPQRLHALQQADPDFGMAQCLRGYFALLAYKQAVVPAAQAAERAARELTSRATPREQAHVAALAYWIDGELDQAIAVWEQILADHPLDVLAFRLAHFNNFWLGRPQDMAASAERVMPRWSEALPGYGSVLACRCFALEETGSYLAAEPVGRRAIEIDPGDLWAAHAVAHVMEMQGRRGEGIDWLTGLSPYWEGGNHLQHHLWWHCALYHLEYGDTDRVLELYDTRFRNLSSPLTSAQPDVYIDVQNAASMLFRLERLGVDVGERWQELADKAEARIGDCLSAFTVPHWMMALTAAGRDESADRLVDAIRAQRNAAGTLAPILRDCALPLCEAIRAHRAGRHAEAVALMRPALGEMHRLGGSHAQQDVLEQFFLDAARRAGLVADQRMILERAAGRRVVALQRWIGWRHAAQDVVV